MTATLELSASPYFNADLYGISDIEKSIDNLLSQTYYLSNPEKQKLLDCCFFAANAHNSQKRRSGEPYICHPIKVAEILAKEVRFDASVLQAAVLHDVIEDTPTSKAEVTSVFGKEIAQLVDGVSKLEKDSNVSPEELQARTFEKLAIAMDADPRVVMIKFADRMHNMQTLGALNTGKQRRIAQETLDVYVPIAARLGMFIFKMQLEESAFYYLHPWRYQIIKNLLNNNSAREKTIADITDTVAQELSTHQLSGSIRPRRLGVFSAYKKIKKMGSRNEPIENASIPLILIMDDIDGCYRALGLLHQLYSPIFRKLTDYIASPKINGYQSIHTAVLNHKRQVITFQIRTKEMHGVAESGIIAIWRYHNQTNSIFGLKGLPRDKYMRRWLGNIKSLSDLSSNYLEYYEAVKRDLTGFDIQVFTPKGEPIALPEGACVIDFAYHIHTELGNHLAYAKVNGVDVTIDYQLNEGQTVELFTDNSNAMPDGDWLSHVKTGRARTAIRHFLNNLPKRQLTDMGLRTLEAYLQKHHVSYRHLGTMLDKISDNKPSLSTELLLRKIALQDIKCQDVFEQLQTITSQDRNNFSIRVRVQNQPGVLASVVRIIAHHEVNILRIHFPDDMRAKMVVISFEISMEFLSQLDHIIEVLNALHFVKDIQYEELNR